MFACSVTAFTIAGDGDPNSSQQYHQRRYTLLIGTTAVTSLLPGSFPLGYNRHHHLIKQTTLPLFSTVIVHSFSIPQASQASVMIHKWDEKFCRYNPFATYIHLINVFNSRLFFSHPLQQAETSCKLLLHQSTCFMKLFLRIRLPCEQSLTGTAVNWLKGEPAGNFCTRLKRWWEKMLKSDLVKGSKQVKLKLKQMARRSWQVKLTYLENKTPL